MAKNPNIYKFEIIERIITEVDFTTKEDIDYVMEKLTTIVTRLRELSPVNAAKGW